MEAFIMLNAATGASRATGAALNSLEAPPAAQRCTCGKCGTGEAPTRLAVGAVPFDRHRAILDARALDVRAADARTDSERRDWEERADNLWALVTLDEREKARREARKIGTAWEVRPILAQPWEGSVLSDR